MPDLQAVYLFGSRASGKSGPQSDLDLAVLRERPNEPYGLWCLGQIHGR
ncbi:nucleotidyltransferase domain-containing protein [Stutzerimonas tarimensis]|uniref:Nucleotidyltransferase domain-containing protein n=1 Tax=Stutzerimonas tarimensis TaxID=1507735 RepID=A0ABV7T7B6_9GAMM